MKKLLTTFAIIIATIVGVSFFATPVFADSCTCEDGGKGVRTSIIGGGCSCDSGNGDSVINVLNSVVDILTVCIGILGVIGITIVGIQYLTASGNEEKLKKAKRRMFEIIIGLVAYVLIYSFLRWLLPTFEESQTTTQTTQTTQEQVQQNKTRDRL